MPTTPVISISGVHSPGHKNYSGSRKFASSRDTENKIILSQIVQGDGPAICFAEKSVYSSCPFYYEGDRGWRLCSKGGCER